MAKFNNVDETIIEKVVVDDEFRTLFSTMLKEVLDEKRFDTLVSFVDKYMEGAIKGWCAAVPYFNHPNHIDEVKQLTRIKLMQKIVSGFIYVNGLENGINDDPEGFRKWMFTVAKNVKRDYFKKERRIFMHQSELPDTEWNVEHAQDLFEGMEEDEISDGADGEGYSVIDDLFIPDYVEKARDILNDSFRIVMESNSNVYIPLTWIASSLYIYVFYKTRKDANKYVIGFGEYTLEELYKAVIKLSENIPWLVIDGGMKANIEKSLAKTSDIDESRTFGECKYSEFFGEKPTVRVSDWMYRMSQKIIKTRKKNEDKKGKKENQDENGNK